MKNWSLRAVMAGAFTLAALPFAAATITLGSAADADAVAGTSNLGDDYADNNFGGRGWICENWTGATDVIGHIRFDLSSVGAGTVASAKMRLFHDFNGQNGITYDAFQVLQDWTEGGLTYDTRPNLSASAVSSLAISDSSTGLYREFDVTSIVQDWVNGNADNFGLALKRDPSASPWAYFRSKENASGNLPELVIETVPEPASMAALAIGAAALLRRRRK